MKKSFCLILLLLFTLNITAQNFEEVKKKAEEAGQNKDYDSSSKYYKYLFSHFNSADYLDYYYAAFSANLKKKKEEKQAIKWLEKSAQKGLGKEKGELEAILKQVEFENLHTNEKWNEVLGLILKNKAKKKENSEKWMKEILESDSSEFTLKFYDSKKERLPYLLFIPTSVDLKKSPPLVTFLHGGRGQETFYDYYSLPELGTDEPIFKIAEELQFIVMYPIQKSSYGWYNSKDPLKDIQKIVKDEVAKLDLNKSKIIAGGMSNGGKATFWLAQQEEALFDGYFTVSAEPKLEFGKIDFTKITKPFISIHSKSDEIFPCEETKKIYDQENQKTKFWQMEVIDAEGGHGFIYNPDNYDIFKNFIAEILTKVK